MYIIAACHEMGKKKREKRAFTEDGNCAAAVLCLCVCETAHRHPVYSPKSQNGGIPRTLVLTWSWRVVVRENPLRQGEPFVMNNTPARTAGVHSHLLLRGKASKKECLDCGVSMRTHVLDGANNALIIASSPYWAHAYTSPPANQPPTITRIVSMQFQ